MDVHRELVELLKQTQAEEQACIAQLTPQEREMLGIQFPPGALSLKQGPLFVSLSSQNGRCGHFSRQ